MRLSALMTERRLPFKYVGNGAVIIGGLNPDFINVNGHKQVVELFGRAFHDPSSIKKLKANIPYRQTAEGRCLIYAEYGFETLIIWDDELHSSEKATLEKICAFSKGGESSVRETTT